MPVSPRGCICCRPIRVNTLPLATVIRPVRGHLNLPVSATVASRARRLNSRLGRALMVPMLNLVTAPVTRR